MQLYIAEKPSLGRAIAAAFPKPQKKHQGYIELANGDCISWCIGHLLEQAEPDQYQEKYKKWQLDHLPIAPQQWQLVEKKQTKSQLSVLKKLIKQAEHLVHAGDPDREGQLLVDEVISYSKVSKSKQNKTQRLLVSDLTPAAVKRALNKLRPNSEFVPLSTSALARSRADWLYGMNMTRAYTLLAQRHGYSGVLSVGRVQTPVLGLVVRRCEELDNFISKPFYEIIAHLKTEQNEMFSAKWQANEACQAHLDEDGRLLNQALAQNIADRINNQPATVEKYQAQNKKQPAPLPYNLSALQVDANKILNLSAKQTLDICQSLYEKHQAITYPRSESRHLPNEHFKQANNVISAIAKTAPELEKACYEADSNKKNRTWNDNKVDAHHAIIPTSKVTKSSALSALELKVYQLIAKQYLAQFYPEFEYSERKAEIRILTGLFKASAKSTLIEGWKVLFQSKKLSTPDPSIETGTYLPALEQGQPLHCLRGEVLNKMTQAPKLYTEATLLQAMTGIARFVKDPKIKKILKDTDGLGTEATRAGIIELLFKRQFLQKQGKSIRATESGKKLIAALPEQATWPDMTAHWESMLNSICNKEVSYQSFMQPMQQSLELMISDAIQQPPTSLSELPKQDKNSWKKGGYKKKRSSTQTGRRTQNGTQNKRKVKAKGWLAAS